MTTRLPNPFERHDLSGWRSPTPGVRFPPSFSIERDGDVHLLFVAPVSAPMLRAALDLPAEDAAALLDHRGVAHARPWGAPLPDTDLELVHLGAPGTVPPEDLPSPLVSDPASLPRGCAAALSVQDGCHGVVLSRDPDRISRCLRRFLDAYVEAAAGTCARVPAVPGPALDGLLATAPEGATCRPALDVRPRFWVMDLDWRDADGAALGTDRWVSEGPHGRWRAGWRW
jgi:hypothetical protein